jgi:hypothetical protein
MYGEAVFTARRLTRHGIDPARVKRMTAAEPFQAHPDTSSRSMHFDRLPHILGAGWIKPAGGRQQGGNQAFVPGEEQDEDFAHLIKRRLTSA